MQFYKLLACAVTFSAPVLAQSAFGMVDGYIDGPDGKAVAGAVIGFDKVDAKMHQETKTDKKGYFSIYTLPVGDYSLTVTVEGQLREHRPFFHVSPGRQNNTAGNLATSLVIKLKTAEAAKAQFEKEAGGSASKDGEGAAAANKARDEETKRNQMLVDSFTIGQTAIATGQWDQAIDSLTKAAQADPKQASVWSALADAWIGKSKKQTGADAAASLAKAQESFAKAVEIAPSNAAFYNDYALSMAGIGKLDEAKANLAKAIELEPAGAGKYYYNLGALLMNQGNMDAAAEQFKKAIETDPNYAEAHYQYATLLLSRATADASGKVS